MVAHDRPRLSATAEVCCARPICEEEGHRVRTGESRQARARALQRGTLVHRLLQSLPDIAADRRHDAALDYLGRNAGGWTDGRARVHWPNRS